MTVFVVDEEQQDCMGGNVGMNAPQHEQTTAKALAKTFNTL